MARYEIQVPRKLKDTIEEIASEVAEEYATPRSIRQRMCKARAEVLEKATQNIRHEFFELKDRIRELKQQIEAQQAQAEAPVPQGPPPQGGGLIQ